MFLSNNHLQSNNPTVFFACFAYNMKKKVIPLFQVPTAGVKPNIIQVSTIPLHETGNLSVSM